MTLFKIYGIQRKSFDTLPIFILAKTDFGFVVVAPLGVHQLQVVAQIALK